MIDTNVNYKDITKQKPVNKTMFNTWPLNKLKEKFLPNNKNHWKNINNSTNKNFSFLEIDINNENSQDDFFSTSDFGMALVDSDDNFIRVNKSFAKILGYSFNELYQIKCDELTHPDDIRASEEAMQKLMDGKTFICSVDKRYSHKGGRFVSVNITYSTVRDKKSNKTYFLLQINDKTKQVQSAQQIKNIDQKYSLIINSLGEGVYAIGLDGKCLFINPAAFDILGYKATNIPSDTSMHDLFHTCSNHSEEGNCSICSYDAQLGKLQKGVETFRRRNGEFITVKYSATPLVEGLEIIGTVIIFRDDSARLLAENSLRESEARFRALYNNTPSMLISVNSQGNIIEVSDHWLKKMAHQRDFVSGSHFTDFVDVQSQDEIRNLLSTSEKVGRSHSSELNLLTSTNDIVETDTDIIAENNSAGELERYLIVSVDVTEKRRTERQLMQSQKMEAIGQLTGGIAHDFNNILQVIIGNLQVLERQIHDTSISKAKEKINRAITAADKARDLTKRLLAFSRKQVLEISQTNFNEHLVEFQHFLTRSIREDIQLNLNLSDTLWSCDLDLSQFENSILNLCVNSVGAMPDSGSITIETRNITLKDKATQFSGDIVSGDFVTVCVEDTGLGIDSEILPNVIDPFFTTKPKEKGTGLGLSMVYGFVQQTGGFMEIESELGVGTKITLYFPKAKNEVINSIAKVTKTQNEILCGNEKTILLVEDNREVQDVVCSILQENNYITHAFDNPQEVKRQVEAGLQFDLLLTDVIMPGDYRGPDLANAIRENIPDLKVLYLSGYTDDAFLSGQCLKENEKFLSKPIDFSKLLSVVQTMLLEGQ